MRLIDADEINLSRLVTCNLGEIKAADIKKLLNEQPTITPAVRGRNVSESHPVDEFECSECGVILEGYSQVIIDEHDNDRSNREYEHRFCPECGAKIDLEVT